MRRCALVLLALLLALNGAAVAEISTWPGEGVTMKVVNCEEWVSLRAEPYTSSERLAQIPLGGVVYNCRQHSQDFVHCETYDGESGYILSQYLAAPTFRIRKKGEGAADGAILSDPAQFEGGWSVTFVQKGLQVLCVRDYGGEVGGERLRVTCFDAQGNFLWGLCTESVNATELDSTAAYGGGTMDRPLMMVYNADLGLVAIEPATGTPRWTLDSAKVNLGASQSHAVGPDGTLYVGGYYGPHPVAISASGEVLWQSDAGDDAVWLHEIRVEGDQIIGEYDPQDDYGVSRVVFDRATGAVLRKE